MSGSEVKSINGKIIIMGDFHFGVRRFNIESLKDQLSFIDNEVIPYMEKNNINIIFQLGDLFDNRTSVDIIFMEYLKKNFFDKLKEKNIILYTLLGNHDIAHRESRSVSLSNFFEDLYPENFYVFKHRESIIINGNSTYIVPWIVKDEDLTYEEIKNHHNIFGHFEIRHFTMVKGHKDSTAKLTVDFFTKNTNVRNVFSGHYHIKDTSGLVKYLGTPWQLNWSDYEEQKGFYVFHEDDFLEFYENKSSKKYIKVKYNDDKDKEKHIEVCGLYEHPKLMTDEEFYKITDELKNHEVKFFINESKDRHFDEILYNTKDELQCTVIDNQEISEIIGADYIEEENVNIDDTRTFIIESIKEEKPELIKLFTKILEDIDSSTNIK